MRPLRFVVAALAVGVTVAGWTIAGAGQAGQLPLEPLGNRGEALFPYLEGWFENDDGTFSILFGYHNRNTTQSFEIPIGPDNRFEPGDPDRGQPTHFRPERNNRMFTVAVPREFGQTRLTWTLTANGLTQAVTAWLDPEYFVEPYLSSGTGNTPPVIRIGAGGDHTGPPRGLAQTLEATVSEPLTLSVWAADKGNTIVLDALPPLPGRGGRGRGAAGRGGGGRGGAGRGGRGGGPPAVMNASWGKYRGPGTVTFADQSIELFDEAGSTGATTATFDQPGEYWLRVAVNEGAGGGGSGQCCSTSTLVQVNVQPAGAPR